MNNLAPTFTVDDLLMMREAINEKREAIRYLRMTYGQNKTDDATERHLLAIRKKINSELAGLNLIKRKADD